MDTSTRSVLSVLPKRTSAAVERLLMSGSQVEEVRLRTGRPAQVISSSGEYIEEAPPFTREDASDLLERLCRHSVYAREDELRLGFITLDGGARVGVCGRPVVENGRIRRMTDVTSFNFRLTREAVGCAESVMDFVLENGRPVSTLIAAPPAGGKTTLLRDMARCLSNGICSKPFNVALLDERGELAGQIDGVPSFDVGLRTDVMEFAPKAEAIGIIVRTMNPDVILTDEIGGYGDAEALEEAARCGAAVIASAHASGCDELKRRPALQKTISSGVFKRILLLRRNGSVLHISPVRL